MQVDPFTQVTQRLIAILRNSPAITGPFGIGVKGPNIVDLTESVKSQDYPVPTPTAGQTPQILVLPSRGVFHPYGTNSRIATANRTWLLTITTDTLRLGGEAGAGPVTLFSVEWAMMLAFVSVSPDLGLTGMVRGYQPMIVNERGLLDDFPMLSQGTPRRWTAVLAVEVDLYWSSQALMQYIASITPS